jgi:adenylate cyclase
VKLVPRLSLRAKWTIAVLVVALVPLLVVGLTVLRLQRQGLARIEKELEAAVVDEASSRVAASFEVARSLATDTAELLSNETEDVDARLRQIRTEAGRAPEVQSLAFFDDAGRFVDAVVTRDAADELLRTAPEAEGFLVTREASDAAVRFAKKTSGGPGGFVVVTVALDVVRDRLRDLSLARFGAPDRVYVVDQRGGVVIGATRATSGPPPLLASLPSGGESLGVELVLTTEFDEGGVAKVGTLRTLPALHLGVIVERRADEAFATLAQTRRALIGAMLLFATLAALGGLLFARLALSPIGSLVRLIERYGRRDFSARSEVRSGDELEALGGSLESMADELAKSELEIARRARVEANLARYLPAEVTASAKAAERLELGGARRSVSVLFADVVAFTRFAERTSPERAASFLNELFTLLSEIVFRHDGMVDKFIGDSVMAVFHGGDGEGTPHAARALAAAEDMHRFVASSRARWQNEFQFDVRLDIGVATGEALVGNLGSASRMEYTAIGDTVNVAARLESLARPSQTLTTPAVVAACPDFEFSSLGEHTIRGRESPLEIFEVVS